MTVLRLAATAGFSTKATTLTRRDLIEASEAFVTNSVRGVVPVRSVDGTVLPAAPGPVTARLAAALADDEAAAARATRCPPPSDPRGRAGARMADRATARTGRASPLVVLIDNYDSFTFNLAHYLVQAGCRVEVVNNDEVTASDVVAVDPAGVVISPGPGAPREAGISIDTVRACAAASAEIPVLGVCLGHQAIAACFGAIVSQAPRPVHGQTSVIIHDGHGVLAGLPRRFPATRYHSLIVAEPTLPPCLQVTAWTRGGLLMGLRHVRLPIEGVQFHPESILTTRGQRIINTFAATLRARLRGG
jgi:anthranilate synthase/aminodeoxychorismate synthase-like glutamine amidotransferase